jgi:tetratricopeptide (TPR) repeat protein
MSNYSFGDYGAALNSFRKASAERHEDIPLKLKIAECFINTIGTRGKGRLVELQAYFKSVMFPLADKNRDARILLLRYYLAENKLIEAEEIIEGLLRDGEKASDFYVVLVQFKVKKNKVSEAKDIALKSFSYTPDWMKAMKLLIDQLNGPENYQSLEKIYKKMIEQVPNKLPYQQDLANIYRKQGNLEMENMLLQEMLKSNPDNLQVKTEYVNFLIRYNRKGDAESFLDGEINKQPANIQLKKIRIDFFVQSGQMQKAYQQTEEVLRALPKDTNNYIEFQNIFADICFRSGEYEKAKINVE